MQLFFHQWKHVKAWQDQEPEINLMFLKIMEEMGFKA